MRGGEKMFRNLKRILDDEEATILTENILTALLGEIIFLLNPISWLCCLPCIWGVYGFIRVVLMEALLWPLDIIGIILPEGK